MVKNRVHDYKKLFKNLALGLLFIVGNAAFGRNKSTLQLQADGKLGIRAHSCEQYENKIGQLLYVNVDGFGPGSAAIDPAYINMVKDLQIGGVLPHPNTWDPVKLRQSYAELLAATEQPLMIGIDNHEVAPDIGPVVRFGMGWGAGYLSNYGSLKSECLFAKSFLDAFLHRWVGLNQALGPTVENNQNHSFLNQSPDVVAPKATRAVQAFSELGVATTMKHFPYTPTDFNLHDKSEDTKIPREKVLNMLKIYKEIGNKTGFAMSTHLLNSNIDPNDMATFSKEWVRILREDLGFGGILMTDALFMFDQYRDSVKHMSSKWPQDQVPLSDIHSIFAARAILAGHDMAFLESTARDTYQVFNDLLYVACQDKPISRELRTRIDESYERITMWKTAHKSALKQSVTLPDGLGGEAAELYKRFDSDVNCSRHIDRFKEFKRKVMELKIVPLPSAAETTPTMRLRPEPTKQRENGTQY